MGRLRVRKIERVRKMENMKDEEDFTNTSNCLGWKMENNYLYNYYIIHFYYLFIIIIDGIIYISPIRNFKDDVSFY